MLILQIDWDDWRRDDGTTQTWHDLSPGALRGWERMTESTAQRTHPGINRH